MRSLISRAAVTLLALTLLAGGVAAQAKKKKRAKATKATTAQTKTPPPQPQQPYTGDPVPPPQVQEAGDGVNRITAADARAALDKGTAIIIDVRNEESYKMGHIKGSRSIPVNDFVARIKDLPRDKMIITYCS
jgi:3-mercaptopyruvate sulfurtransferase SseA